MPHDAGSSAEVRKLTLATIHLVTQSELVLDELHMNQVGLEALLADLDSLKMEEMQ